MPENKNQHYVPQFLLKKFSVDNKTINLYNLKSSKFIKKALIKNQCSKDYFYSKNIKFEKALSDIEGVSKKLFDKLINTHTLPKHNSADHHTLLTFNAFQTFRTKYSSDLISESIANLLKDLFKKDIKSRDEKKLTDKDIDESKIVVNEPAQLILSQISFGLPLLFDLEYKLIINKTKKPFILSDNPGVLYNLAFIEKNNICTTGMQSKGLMILLPIDFNHLILFYDKNIYKVGSKKHKPIEITILNDVDELNNLQILNSYENIYYIYFDESKLERQINKIINQKRVLKSEMTESPIIEEKNGKKSQIIHTKRIDIKYKIKLSFCKIRKDNINYSFDFEFRDNKIMQLFNLFEKEVKEKKYKPSEWNRFLRDIKKIGQSIV